MILFVFFVVTVILENEQTNKQHITVMKKISHQSN